MLQIQLSLSPGFVNLPLLSFRLPSLTLQPNPLLKHPPAFVFFPTKINRPLLLLRMLVRELVKVVRLRLGVAMLQDVVQVGQPVLERRLERVVLG